MSLEFDSYEMFEIRDICDINNSSYSKRESWSFFNYLDTKNITKGKIDEIKYLDPLEDTIPSRAKRKVNNKDIIYSTVRPNQEHYGLIENQPDNFLVSTGFTTLKVDTEKAIPEYVYYFITQNHITESLQTIAEQSTTSYPSIRPSDIGDLIIPLPSLHIQNKISSILKNIDKKIKLNEQINHNLEESIKSIFKYYFVDFIPFIKDLEKGIPKDWESLNLGDVVSEANTGADAIKKAPIVNFDTGIKCVRVGDMTNSRRVDEWAFSEVSEENYKKYQLKKDDIIVTRTATLGLNLLITEDLEAVYNNGLIRIKLDKNKVFPLFIYYYLNTSDYVHYIDSIEGESSTRPNMKINYLLKFPILCPPMKIQEDFINIVESLFNLKEKLFNQTVELTKLRDTLLPKLMSGEIDVSKVNCD